MGIDTDSLIAAAANTYGLNDRFPGYLQSISKIESGGDPSAYNSGSGASGLFQFVPSTARQYGLSDPFDPSASADAGARFTLDNAAALSRALGRDPDAGELYMAHQQGAGGAAKLLANPTARAGDLVGDGAVTSNGGRPDMTAGEFVDLWRNKYAKASGQPSSSKPSTSRGFGSLAGGTSDPSSDDKPEDSDLAKLMAAAQTAQPKAADDDRALTPRTSFAPVGPVAFDRSRYMGLLSRRKLQA